MGGASSFYSVSSNCLELACKVVHVPNKLHFPTEGSLGMVDCHETNKRDAKFSSNPLQVLRRSVKSKLVVVGGVPLEPGKEETEE